MLRFFLFIALLCLNIGCTPKLQRWFVGEEDVRVIPMEYDARPRNLRLGPCRVKESYLPDTNRLNETPIRYMRVNFHIMNTRDSSQNFKEKEGIKFVKSLLYECNKEMKQNAKMRLPHGNDTPVLPTQLRWKLSPNPNDPTDDGIHFHYDDELYYYVHKGKNRNLTSRTVINKYGVQLDTVLNIFMMPHHPDSIASKTYMSGQVGVALGNAVKVAGFYENGKPSWFYKGCFNHEIGHILGLSHAWTGYDGCDDTPKHLQICWSPEHKPGCDTLCSNNVMDYNYKQNAWTPCQLAKVHFRLSSLKNRSRKMMEKTWCTLNEKMTVSISDTTIWDCHKDLSGHLIIKAGAQLTMQCRISIPKGGKIIIEPGAQLILDGCQLFNECGWEWEGIEIQKLGKIQGEVISMRDPKIENVRNPIQT